MSNRNGLVFYKGVKDAIPIAIGYISVSFAFGISAVEQGLPLWSPILISLSNFTGTGQFVGVNMIASGAVLFEIAFTVLIINLRYMLMSLSLSQKLSPDVKFWQRLVIAFGNTDEIFAVSIQQKDELNFRYMIGLILTSYLGWNAGTALGALASSILPLSVRSALGIAIFAMFIAIIVPPAKSARPVLRVVVISIAMSCIFRFVPGLNAIGSGWVFIICGVVSAGVGAYLNPVAQVKDGEDSDGL